MPTTDTHVNNLIINVLTEAQYSQIPSPSPTELYLVPEIVDTTPTQGSTNTITSGAVYTALQSAMPSSVKYGASLSLTINSSTFVITGQLKDQDGNNLGSAQTIDLPLESVVVGGRYDDATKKVILTLENGNTVEFSVADLVAGLQNEITSQNPLSADLVVNGTTNKVFTATEQTKLAGIEAGAEVNVQSDWDQSNTGADDYIKNKPTIDTSPITDNEYNYIFGTADGIFITALYIDDYPEETIPEIELTYHCTFNEHISNICNNFSYAKSAGTNFFSPTPNTIEYDSDIYRIWIAMVVSSDDSTLQPVPIYALMSDSITYAELNSMSMENNILNRYSPFVVVVTNDNTNTYDQDLGDSYTLVHVETINRSVKPINPSHIASFNKLYLEQYSAANGQGGYTIFENMIKHNTTSISNFVNSVINEENPEQTFIYSGHTIEYGNNTYQLWWDEAAQEVGGLISMNTTYQDIYPHTLEANSNNFYTSYCPFEYTWKNMDNEESIGDYDPVTDKWTTTIAVR